ncbi:MAG TPA: tetratricopeptide repeat protein [Bacteroidales bacterium]|nr:tetratricopeptide repeat protein [Bacteroidales bacterium]
MLQFRHLILKDVKYLNFFLILCTFAIFIATKTSAQESLSKLSEADRQVYNEYQNQISRFASVSNHYELARYYTLAGNLLWKNKLHEDAIRFFEKALDENRILGNQNAIKVLNNNIGIIYTELGKDETALIYFNESLKINRALNKKAEIAYDLINIGLSLQNLGRYSESNQKLEEALELTKEENDLKTMKTCYGMMAENYEKLGNSAKSMEYYNQFNSIQKFLQQQEIDRATEAKNQAEARRLMTELELASTQDTLSQVIEISKEKEMQIRLLNTEKQLQESKIKEQEARIRSERLFRLVLVGIVFFVLLVAFLIYIQLRQKKKANELLAQKNAEISAQKQKITDSIHYAHRIQKAVLTPREEILHVFAGHFIYFQPRELVSGDFYLLSETKGYVVVSAVDCTGHGVPGAFMSMLGISFLNEILSSYDPAGKDFSAATILNQMREKIILSLHQTGARKETKDGMDMSICLFEPGLKKVHFAGAHNSMYLIRNNELQQFDADKMPISIHRNAEKPFTNHEIPLQKDDCIYLFTDGYADQPGGEKGRKFLSRNLKQLLLDIHTRNMNEQKAILQQTFENWKNGYPQRDDILILGIKIP